MAVTINASTTTGLVQSADLSGSLNIQSNGTTVLGVTSTGTSVTGTQSVSGNLSFNSGYGSSAVAYDKAAVQAYVDAHAYIAKRASEYPNVTEYLDGVVKGDQAQIDKYIADCLAVKARHPKGVK